MSAPAEPAGKDCRRLSRSTHTIVTWVVVDDGPSFRIVVRRRPNLRHYVALCVFFAAIPGTFAVLAIVSGHPSAWAPYGFVGFGLSLGVLASVFTALTFRSEARRGPYLRFDRATGTIELPRVRRVLSRAEVLRIEQVCFLAAESRCYELHLVTTRDGDAQRLLVLATTSGEFPATLDAFQKSTDIPVARVEVRDEASRSRR